MNRKNPSHRWIVLGIVSAALFLIIVDLTVLYTALPRLTQDLSATASEKLWILNAYSLVAASLLPGTGTLGDKIGAKKIFLIGLVIFGAASLFAAYSTSPSMLIAGRVGLAIGAAAMMPATLAILRIIFDDPEERSFAIGIWASIASGGAAVGPLLGGLLLEYFWWGSVFLINVPIIAVVIVLTLRYIPALEPHPEACWDLLASLLTMFGLFGLIYAIKELSKREPSLLAFTLAVISGFIALALFIRRNQRMDPPLIDFTLFKNKDFTAGVAGAVTLSVALLGVQLVLTQRLQLVLEMSPLEAGIHLIPLSLAAFIAGPIAGRFLERIGSTRAIIASLPITGVGAIIAGYGMNAPLFYQFTGFILIGAGIGVGMTAASAAIMGNAPADRAGMAASLEEVSYELGGTLGVALMGSVMSVAYTAAMVLPEALADVPLIVQDSLDEALLIAETLPENEASLLIALGKAAFDHAYLVVNVSASIFLALSALAVFWLSRPSRA